MLNPMLLLAAAQNPEVFGPLLDQSGAPPPAQLIPLMFGEQSNIGAMLASAGGADPMGLGGAPPPIPPDLIDPTNNPNALTPSFNTDPTNDPNALTPAASPYQVPPGTPAPPPYAAPPGGAPTPAARPPGSPQVKAPTAPSPVFSGGVAGAQKAPELGVKIGGTTPAAALMMALLNPGGRAGDPLRVPTLGGTMRR